eukprot:TRINITY_DN29695_c0_g1_i1.p1 TRINITY_DN29695_c0_g1~~TRINITY_DN29695_c0_g1_i1.p1  ORF type:complete len:482 (+),score=143.48 TRINITY_DN29695_c0_g1_i1:447-1892(+)
MIQLLIIGGGAAGLAFLVKRAVQRLHQRNKDGTSQMDILGRGLATLQGSIGPIEPQDLAMGMAVLAKIAEKEPPEPIGEAAEKESHDAHFLLEAQHWRAHCEAMYASHPAEWALLTGLPENTILTSCWTPDEETLRPAFVVCVDAAFGAAVVGIRGTQDLNDLMINAATHPEEFEGGQAHAGFVRATTHLLKDIEPYLDSALEELSKHQPEGGGGAPPPRLVLVGHSLGAAVGALAGLRLRSRFPSLRCWGLGMPACVNLELAHKCKEFSTSFFAAHDLIPRLSMATMEKLRQRILQIDWEATDKLLKGDPEWENLKKLSSALRSIGKTTDSLLGGGDKWDESKKEENDKAEKQEQNGKENGDQGGGNEEATRKESAEKEKDEEGPLKLYPPGVLFCLNSKPPYGGKKPEQRPDAPQQRQFGVYMTYEETKETHWWLTRVEPEMLDELLITPYSISDHYPAAINLGLDTLQRSARPIVPAS